MKDLKFRIIFCLLLFITPLCSQTATVETITLQGSPSLDGLVVGSDGFIYAADGFDGNRVYKIALDGTTTEIVSGLAGPIDMDFDPDGNLFVTTFNNSGVYKITGGTSSRYATVSVGPSGLVMNQQTRTLYVSHYGSGAVGNGRAVYSVDTGANSAPFVTNQGLNAPVSIAIDENGNLYTGNIADAKIIKITPNAEVSHLTTLPRSGKHIFNIGHLCYTNGALFVTGNSANPHVYRVDPNGSFGNFEVMAGSGEFGRADGPALQASFNGPNGIAASVTGDTLFITELNSPNIIRMVIFSGTSTHIGAGEQSPDDFVLAQNYPNPFNPSTNITFSLSRAAHVAIRIYDILGKESGTLINESRAAGDFEIQFDAANLPSGVFFYTLEIDGRAMQTRKMTLMR